MGVGSTVTDRPSPFSAAEQSLGYIYQPRYALLKILELPEESAIFLEKEDDLDFVMEGGRRSLTSLKHKATGDVLTDLSVDFWKSVRIWLTYYLKTGGLASRGRFILVSTASISESSFLVEFTDRSPGAVDRVTGAQAALAGTKSSTVIAIRDELAVLNEDQLRDFYDRITIIDAAPRITELPALIAHHLRSVHRDCRDAVFERLEGWWNDLMIRMLAGDRVEPVYGHEVSDKLNSINEEYRSDNLPITFRDRVPNGQIDAANDPRLFVEQLRALELPVTRIQRAILDYYRAFEQRSSWARESLLVSGEIEEYEDRLLDEWALYKEVLFEHLDRSSDAAACLAAGRELYRWAELETLHLRIRERVTEPYVVRGAFHILANAQPQPRVHWHPQFLDQLQRLLGVAA
jgi:hypothetical protein